MTLLRLFPLPSSAASAFLISCLDGGRKITEAKPENQADVPRLLLRFSPDFPRSSWDLEPFLKAPEQMLTCWQQAVTGLWTFGHGHGHGHGSVSGHSVTWSWETENGKWVGGLGEGIHSRRWAVCLSFCRLAT